MKMERYKATFLILALMRGHVFAVYQDMTWVMDMDHISYHPIYATEQFRFKYNIDVADTSHGVFIAYNSYSTVEHMGTHIDAPYHVYEDGLTMDKVPLEDLIGPLVKIDMQERAKQDSDAAITMKDLQDWEERNGKIPDGSFIIMSSGWDKFYGNNSRYVGTEEEGGPTHSPGFGEEATEWLKNKRNIKGIGVDTVNCDAGNSGTLGGKYIFPAHQIILPAQKLCIENLRSVDKVPECGAKLSALPIIMKNGTGTQARVFAEWFPGVGYMTDCNGALKQERGSFMGSAGQAQFAPVVAVLLAVMLAILMI